MALSAFDLTLQSLHATGGKDLWVSRRLLAALADLAADNLEPTADTTRALLLQACDRIAEEWRQVPEIVETVQRWRRSVVFFPARDAREMRCFAVREAEKYLRATGRGMKGPSETYRSSSVSQ